MKFSFISYINNPGITMNFKSKILLVLLCLSAACTSYASELTYVPLNPQFGGHPSVGSALLGQAQATNKHKDASPFSQQTALQQFNDALSRSIMGQLASAATSSIIGPNGKLVPGTIQTGNFRITIVDSGGGMLTITTTDLVTGATTTFIISGGTF
jgi:curli production assembly/transport component CsgF